MLCWMSPSCWRFFDGIVSCWIQSIFRFWGLIEMRCSAFYPSEICLDNLEASGGRYLSSIPPDSLHRLAEKASTASSISRLALVIETLSQLLGKIIRKPVHCVLKWSTYDGSERYLHCIQNVRRRASPVSLCQWEGVPWAIWPRIQFPRFSSPPSPCHIDFDPWKITREDLS